MVAMGFPLCMNDKWIKTLAIWSRWILLCSSLLFFTSCGSSKTIVNGLDEKEANEILVFLAARGIEGTKQQSTEGSGGGGTKVILWDIKVDTDQATTAMAMLNQAGLPRRRGQSLLGIFSGGGLVPSELQEKIRYQSGLAEQIASTIRKIDGVLDAEVQISFPEQDPLNPKAKKDKITASVYVKHNGVLDDPNIHLNTKIKRLVAASVPNLDYDNVTVIGDTIRNSGFDRGSSTDENKQYVNVWTMIIAKESVSRFRIVFLAFVIFILLLCLTIVWMGWKVYPLLQRCGGIKELFHIHPLKLEEKPKEDKEDKESTKEGHEDVDEEAQQKNEDEDF
jgi:type III secretion protein J